MSILTAAQKTTLKTFINGDVNISGQPANSDGAFFIAAYLNAAASPSFFVYRTNIPVQEIYDQITWANLTPTDAPDGTQTWLNRAMHCQGKQFNVQIILQGQATINGAKSNVRAGLQDALTNVPSGASGVTVSAGWVSVRDNALARLATKFEKVFATTGGNGSTAALAAVMAVEGPISYQDVQDARENG